MNSDLSNDNGLIPFREPDAHGQAAIVLVESLIHGLVEGDVLSAAEAVDIVDTAIEVKGELDRESGVSPAPMQSPVELLQAIGASLARDIAAV
ncbi:MAG: hypothetical protein MEQ84_13100 [Mesorhizobium sp.]|nr:hypothetical protein [Mesorhizobium sp.]